MERAAKYGIEVIRFLQDPYPTLQRLLQGGGETERLLPNHFIAMTLLDASAPVRELVMECLAGVRRRAVEDYLETFTEDRRQAELWNRQEVDQARQEGKEPPEPRTAHLQASQLAREAMLELLVREEEAGWVRFVAEDGPPVDVSRGRGIADAEVNDGTGADPLDGLSPLARGLFARLHGDASRHPQAAARWRELLVPFDLLAMPLEAVIQGLERLAQAARVDGLLVADPFLECCRDPYSRLILEAALNEWDDAELGAFAELKRQAILGEVERTLGVVIEGILGVQRGVNPRLLLAEMLAFFPEPVELPEWSRLGAFFGAAAEPFADDSVQPVRLFMPPEALVRTLLHFALLSRRDGILSLEKEERRGHHPFCQQALQLCVDGADPTWMERHLAIRRKSLLAGLERRMELFALACIDLRNGVHPRLLGESLRLWMEN